MTALDTPLGAEPAGEATIDAVPPFEQNAQRPAADLRLAVRPSSVLANSEYEIVSRWADDKRAELARLTTELRAAEAEAEAAERALRERHVAAGRTPATPSDLIPMVDALLADAMGRLDAEVAAARRDAESIVNGALERADAVLLSAGASVAAATQLRPAVELPVVEVERPRPAAELWAEVTTVIVGAPAEPADAPAEANEAPTRSDDVAVVDLTDPTDDFLDDAPRDAAVDMHQLFWADADAEEAVRNRLRRWVQRQS